MAQSGDEDGLIGWRSALPLPNGGCIEGDIAAVTGHDPLRTVRKSGFGQFGRSFMVRAREPRFKLENRRWSFGVLTSADDIKQAIWVIDVGF